MNATAASEASSTVTNAYTWPWFKWVNKQPELADWLNNRGIVSNIYKTLCREYTKLLWLIYFFILFTRLHELFKC
jgi:hypothetical protein